LSAFRRGAQIHRALATGVTAMRAVWQAGCLLILLVFAANSLKAAEPIDWASLPDSAAQDYEDPFVDLPLKHLELLISVAGLRSRVAEGDRNAIRLLADSEEMLVQLGIDADYLISQRWVVADARRRAATAGNPKLDGATVTLAGFAIPAPHDEDGTPTAYLVQRPGMCSHMPPPNPNQMIRLRLTGDWKPVRMHDPVQVSGRIVIDPSERSFIVVDGMVPMAATWRLDVETAQPALRSAHAPATRPNWVASIREKLRAAQPDQSLPEK
jgi:hypothetical protein